MVKLHGTGTYDPIETEEGVTAQMKFSSQDPGRFPRIETPGSGSRSGEESDGDDLDADIGGEGGEDRKNKREQITQNDA